MTKLNDTGETMLTPYYQTDLGVLYCGDCLEILPHLEPVDLVLTDPPYFLPVQHYVGTRKDGFSKRTLGDTSVLRGYFKTFFDKIDHITTIESTWYIFCDGQSYPIFYECIFPYVKYVRPLIWYKIVSYNGYTWRHQHELIAWGERDNAKRVPTGDGDIIRCRGVFQADRFHPAEKPVELIETLAGKHTNGIVLDPFLGSGTTAVACERLGRRWIGIEISEEYCRMAAERIERERKQLKLFEPPVATPMPEQASMLGGRK